MGLFNKLNEDGGNSKYVQARREYLHAIEAVLGTSRRWDVALPSAEDLEAAFELIEPPAELRPFQVEKLQEAMRSARATMQQMVKENGSWAW